MLYDFTFYNPTRIHFGKNAMQALKDELSSFGNTVMLAYGKGAIKKNGIYDEVMKTLQEAGKTVVEFSGIMPNPTYKKVLEGAQLVRDNNVDLILAVGGGSTIDCCKAVSVTAYCEGDAWTKYWVNEEDVDNKIVPVASVLTMVGTGSEMNGGSVVTNEDVKLKNGRVFPPKVYPKFSILNPEYTYTLPEYQMVSGIADILSHLMEQYFSGDDNNVSDYLLEALMRCVIDNTPKAIENPKDYEARSNIMWASTVALNTITGVSKMQDWQVHMIEHQLGAYTDCAHGMGLAAISPAYYRFMYKFAPEKFARFAKKVFGVHQNGRTDEEVALEGIDRLEQFFKDSKMATDIRSLGATEEMLPLIADSTIVGGGYHDLTAYEVLGILKEAF